MLCRAYEEENTSFVVNACGTYKYMKERNERSIFEELVDAPFETGTFKVPKEYDKYLTAIYGDYMKLPPVKQRISRHQIMQINLGGYVPQSEVKEI